MLEFGFLQRVVVDHHHFVLIILGDGKSLAVIVDLMREEFTERSVSFNIGDCPEQRLVLGLIFKGDHE